MEATIKAVPFTTKAHKVWIVECSVCGPLGTVSDGDTDGPSHRHLTTFHSTVLT